VDNILDKDYSLEVDIKNKVPYPNMEFVAADKNTCILNIKITEDGIPVDLTGYDVTLNVKKSDGKLVMQDKDNGVTITDAPNGVIRVVLRTQSIASAGATVCDISLKNVEDKLTTMEFRYMVRENKDNDTAIISVDEISVLDKLIEKITATNNDIIAQEEKDKLMNLLEKILLVI
jgi:hypothetical protein